MGAPAAEVPTIPRFVTIPETSVPGQAAGFRDTCGESVRAMTASLSDDSPDREDLTALFRKTIHAANNELMSIIQECELALVNQDANAMRRALAYTIDHVMAISRLHSTARREIIESIERFTERDDLNEPRNELV
jgi:hypothetical protein